MQAEHSTVFDEYSQKERIEIVEAAQILCNISNSNRYPFQRLEVEDFSHQMSTKYEEEEKNNYLKENSDMFNTYNNSYIGKVKPSDKFQQHSENRKERERVSDHPIHSKLFVKKAEDILAASVDFHNVQVSDRKSALRALLTILCPRVQMRECGNTNKRMFLVAGDKRFRTYGDAIKSGALDELLLNTGTAVLLTSCHDQAEQRYDFLMANKQML